MSKRPLEDELAPDAKKQAVEDAPTNLTCLCVVLKAEQKTIKGEDGESFTASEAWVRLLFQKSLADCMGKAPTVPVYRKDGKNKKFDQNMPLPSEFTVNTKKALFTKGQVLMLTDLFGVSSPSKKTGVEYVNYQAISVTPIMRRGEPVRKMIGGEVEIEEPDEEECVSADAIRVRIGEHWKLAGGRDASFEDQVVLTREFQNEKTLVADFSLSGSIGATEYNILVRLASVTEILCLPRVEKKVVSVGETKLTDILKGWRRFLRTVLLQPWGYIGIKGGVDKGATDTREIADVENKVRQPVCKWPRFWVGKKFMNMLAPIAFETLVLNDFELPKVTFAPALPPFKMGLRVVTFNETEKTEAFLFQQKAYLYVFVPVNNDDGWAKHQELMVALRALEGNWPKMNDKIKEASSAAANGKSLFGQPMLVLFNMTESPEDTAHVTKTWKVVCERNYPKTE